jgi:2-dehydropantoate 2-reductase
MKTLIVGAGIIGTTWGWALSEAGYDVTHFVKQGRQDQYNTGIQLDIIDDRKGHKKNNITQYALKCVESISPSDHFELIILPLHFYQVEAALQTLVRLSGDAIFLDFGTNWNGTDEIDKLLARERYLLGFPYGGGIIQNGKYVTYLGPKVYLGEADGMRTEKLTRVKSFFAKADIQTDIPNNILHLLWTSHSAAVGMSAGMAKAQGVAPFLRDRALMVQCYEIVKELFELCRLRGVDPYRYIDASFLYKIPAWLHIPILRLFTAYNPGIMRILAHVADPARDARQLYIAMMKTAQELNFDIPRAKAVDAYLQSK